MSVRSLVVWVAWLLNSVFVVVAAANPFFSGGSDLPTTATLIADSLTAFSLATTGAVLVTRLPRNPIGWLLYASGLLFGLADLGPVATSLSPAVGVWIAWLASVAWTPALVSVGILLPLVFPNGRLPSPGWRGVGVGAILAACLSVFQNAFSPFIRGNVPPGLRNPLALGGFAATLVDVGGAASVAGVVLFPVAAASLIVRYRTAQGIERAQLRWLAAALVIIGPSLMLGIATNSATSGLLAFVSTLAWLLVTIGIAVLPLAIAVAVLRYRLYDIDLILNRAVVYASVSVVLAAIFLVGNVVLQQVVQALTHQGSELLTIALAFSAGLLFGPIRRRLRPLVDQLLPSRAEVTLLFTDIAGSTEQLVALGDQRWRALLGRFLSAVRAELARYGGHEVNTAGDAFFATFQRPSDAVRAAWAIRAAVKELGLEIRIGLHLGEVEMRGEQVSGLAVHTAARVMAAASAGEILVSDALRAAVEAPGFATSDRGRHELKGVPGAWQLYAVDLTG